MTKGGRVRVSQDGSASAAIGTILLLSANERSIIVSFPETPPFATAICGGHLFHPEHGVCLFAVRVPGTANWSGISGGGIFQITPEAVQ